MSRDQDAGEKRNRGGQPGNINALKHGRYIQQVPVEQLPEDISESLEQEIAMLRQATRRVISLADQASDIDQAIKVLGALGLASIRTSRLLNHRKRSGMAIKPSRKF